MYVFIDTEFTRFDCPVQELISIACVTEDGRSWYGIHADFPRAMCSEFVVEHVLPHLHEHPPDVLGSLAILAAHLQDWLEGLDTHVTVVVDYMGDWYHFFDLLEHLGSDAPWPAWLSKSPDSLHHLLAENNNRAPDQTELAGHLAAFLHRRGLSAHNALSDALANREAFNAFAQ